MRKPLSAALTTVAVLGLPACAAPAPPPPAPPVPPAPPPPAVERPVRVTVSGAGAVFRVRGEVFGDTGPIDMPPAGTDSAAFSTPKSPDQLVLRVEVWPGPDGTGDCAITVADQPVVQARAAPDSPTALCDLHGA
ncbi:hypothetical protein [Amycolatopsis suaedae]|uniref:IPT/TIG domain-containing protein n=1 Tax=Amycolatopsis suaedae TaxID=2510978 RepID=A0A4Q7J1E7_9PSEU|nr:hypothetical protein [Amycolatopsis suaedae]RZQ60412.1 hypothetical protein EWH70_29370 [Amycolatopsis suaedae]